MSYHLFQAYGIEIEYMLVDGQSLDVRPLAEPLLSETAGPGASEFENGTIAWSNELVTHVIELKTNGPTQDLVSASKDFHRNVADINRRLEKHDGRLLGTGCHPWMNPVHDGELWPHEQREIYELYDRIFDCRTHGWMNLQSVHLNLPFGNDEEFGRLHAAVRLVLPLIPAIAASTPVMDGAITDIIDARLAAYIANQKKFPTIAGRVIPEPVFTKLDYEQEIFAPMLAEMERADPGEILERQFLNSRGAIARFDRGAIEIRLVDTQENPRSDLAIASFLVALIKELVQEKNLSWESQQAWAVEDLRGLLDQTILEGERAVPTSEYLAVFGIRGVRSFQGLLSELFDRHQSSVAKYFHPNIELILGSGTLSTRILRRLHASTVDRQALHHLYHELAESLANDTQWIP